MLPLRIALKRDYTQLKIRRESARRSLKRKCRLYQLAEGSGGPFRSEVEG
jgi:hypothetical protein